MIHASFHFQLKYICFGCKAPHIHYSKLKTTPFPPAHWLPPATFKIFFLFHIFDHRILCEFLRKSFIQKIGFVGLILEKIEGVKVYKPTPGGQPVKILFLFESSQEFTGHTVPQKGQKSPACQKNSTIFLI